MRNILLFKAFRALTERPGPDGPAARTVVHVVGEVDVATSPLMAAAIERALETDTGDRAQVVVDLARVRFIDAGGINVLLRAAQQARAVGGTLVLRSPSRAVRRMLDVLRLHDVLAVEWPPLADDAGVEGESEGDGAEREGEGAEREDDEGVCKLV